MPMGMPQVCWECVVCLKSGASYLHTVWYMQLVCIDQDSLLAIMQCPCLLSSPKSNLLLTMEECWLQSHDISPLPTHHVVHRYHRIQVVCPLLFVFVAELCVCVLHWQV